MFVIYNRIIILVVQFFLTDWYFLESSFFFFCLIFLYCAISNIIFQVTVSFVQKVMIRNGLTEISLVVTQNCVRNVICIFRKSLIWFNLFLFLFPASLKTGSLPFCSLAFFLHSEANPNYPV